MGGFMHLSRLLAALSAALLLAATTPQLVHAREIVGFSDPYSSGTVVVKTNERALYYVLGNGKAVRWSAASSRMAAFACTTRTCSISITASAGARRWSSLAKGSYAFRGLPCARHKTYILNLVCRPICVGRPDV
jgi:hypothetical protein